MAIRRGTELFVYEATPRVDRRKSGHQIHNEWSEEYGRRLSANEAIHILPTNAGGRTREVRGDGYGGTIELIHTPGKGHGPKFIPRGPRGPRQLGE